MRLQQTSGETALRYLEHVWNRDLSAYDPDGPLPEVAPVPGENTIAKRRASVRAHRDRLALARERPQRAAAAKLPIRELVIEVTGCQTFIGSPTTVAASMEDLVRRGAADGFILVPHLTPGGLDRFADTVVPLFQERGTFRTEYTGATLRDQLGLPPRPPVIPAPADR